jgi:hypothetical protein
MRLEDQVIFEMIIFGVDDQVDTGPDSRDTNSPESVDAQQPATAITAEDVIRIRG